MSNKRTKAGRKQSANKAKVAKRREPKGNQKPQADLEKKRATVAQLTRVYQALAGQISKTDKGLKDAATQLYHNDEELRQGMSAAEFNLRSHQKAFNAMALELERIRLTLKAILPDTQQEALSEEILQMSDVSLPPEEEGGEPVVVRRVNWPYYHEQVEKDLKILAELEAKRLEEEKAAAEAEAAKKAEEEKAAEEEAVEAELVMGSEEGDEELPEALSDEPEAKEEAQSEPPQDDGIPEGAAVFGGS